MMVSTAQNRFTANRSMAITTILHEQQQMVPCIHFDINQDKPTTYGGQGPGAHSDNSKRDKLIDEDGNGGILLHRLIIV